MSRFRRRPHISQIVFVQYLLSKVQIWLLNIHKSLHTSLVHIVSDIIFDVNTKVLSTNTITSMIKDVPARFQISSSLRRNGSVINEEGRVGIYVRQMEYSFSARLPGNIYFRLK